MNHIKGAHDDGPMIAHLYGVGPRAFSKHDNVCRNTRQLQKYHRNRQSCMVSTRDLGMPENRSAAVYNNSWRKAPGSIVLNDRLVFSKTNTSLNVIYAP